MLSPSYIIIENSKTRGQTVDLDEVAHDEPPHQDLHCLQIQLNSSLVVKELNAPLILCVLEGLSNSSLTTSYSK